MRTWAPIYQKQTGPAVTGPVHQMRVSSDLADVLRLQPLRTLSHVELDVVALGEAAEALCLDRREVHEHVWTRLLRDKAKALRVVKPLHLKIGRASCRERV